MFVASASEDRLEALKQEKFAAAGPYRTAGRPRVLAERLGGLVSQEHAEETEARQKDTSSTEPKRS